MARLVACSLPTNLQVSAPMGRGHKHRYTTWLRGHLQTDFGMLNVRTEGIQPMILLKLSQIAWMRARNYRKM